LPDPAAPAAADPYAHVRADAAFGKYFKMLTMVVLLPAVAQKIVSDGQLDDAATQLFVAAARGGAPDATAASEQLPAPPPPPVVVAVAGAGGGRGGGSGGARRRGVHWAPLSAEAAARLVFARKSALAKAGAEASI
jgi:hypothetical protein